MRIVLAVLALSCALQAHAQSMLAIADARRYSVAPDLPPEEHARVARELYDSFGAIIRELGIRLD